MDAEHERLAVALTDNWSQKIGPDKIYVMVLLDLKTDAMSVRTDTSNPISLLRDAAVALEFAQFARSKATCH